MADYYSNWASSVWGKARYRLHLTLNEVSVDVAGNTSTLAYDLRIEKDRSYDGYYLYHVTSYNLIINGVTVWAGSGASPNKAWTKNTPWVLAQGQIVIAHNADGTLPEVPINANYIRTANEWAPGSMVIGPGGTGPIFSAIPRATTPTVAPSPAAVGAQVTILMPRAVGAYKHDASWVSGNQSGVIGTGLDESVVWTVPSVMGEFPGKTLAPIAITVVTRASAGGTVLGSKQITLFAKEPPVPPAIIPYDPNNAFDIRVRQVTFAGGEWLARTPVEASSIKFVDPASATATVQVTLDKALAVDYPEQSVVDVDIWDGAQWRFTNHRLVLNRNDGDDIDPLRSTTFSGTEFVDYLLGANYAQRDYDWDNATPGEIIAYLINDAKARGWGPRLSIDFNTATNSLGEAWANRVEGHRKVAKGTPVSQVLDGFVNDGLVEYRVEYHSNMAWLVLLNPGTGQSLTDVGSPVVVNLALAELTRAPRRGDASKRITRVTVVGDDTIQQTRERAPFDASVFGALEGWVSASGVATDAGAQSIGDNALRDNFAAVSERTFEYENTISPQYYPYSRYVPGDWVLIPQNDDTPVPDRVSQVTISKGLDAFTITALTGDRIMSGTASLAKRQAAQTGGSIGGGNGGTISPLDSRIPNEPVVDQITSVGYWNLDGAAKSTVTLTWVAVTEAMNGAAIAVDLYEVWSRPAIGEEWAMRTSTNLLTATMEGFDPLKDMEFRVRARSTAGIWGEFSEDQEITTLAPPVDLDGPYMSDLYTDGLGGIYAVWAGLLGSDPAPARLAYVSAEVSSDGGVTYATMGTPIVAAGTIVVNPGVYGEFYVRLRGYDRLGNAGDASDPQVIETINPLVDPVAPTPPTNLAAVAGASWDAAGFFPEAWFDLTWDAPTLDIEGQPVIISGYDVLGRRQGDSVEQYITSTSSTSARIIVTPNEEWTFSVRASSNYGAISAPSDSVTAVADATIPVTAVPDAPTLSEYAGILRIRWSGNGMQPFIRQVYATISTDPGGPFVRVGMPLLGPGEVVVPGLATDTTYYAQIVMVDEMGQLSTSDASDGLYLNPITGVTIQTSPVANTGIKMTSGALTSYDASGNPTFILDAATGEVWIAPYDAVFELGASGAVATTGAPTTGIAISSENSSFNTFIHPSGVQIRNDQTALSYWEADSEDASLVNFFSPRAVFGQRMRVGDYEMLREAKPTGSRLVIRYKGD